MNLHDGRINTHLLVDGVDVGAVVTEQFDNLPLGGAQRRPTANGEMKWSFQLVIGRVHQCSVVQQQLNHVQISRLAREVQRAAPSCQTAAAAVSVATIYVAIVVMARNF